MPENENDIIKQDNALVILKNIKNGIIAPGNLPHEMRRVCVDFLNRQGGYTQEEMAQLLGCSRRTIQSDLDVIEQVCATMLTTIDYKRIVGGLIYKARNLTQHAMKKEDYRLVRLIETELIDKLMSLGFLKKAPE